jgi:hypothetical protein
VKAGGGGHPGQSLPELGGRDPGYGVAESFATCAAAHRFAALVAGVGEAEVLDRDRRALVVPGEVDQPGDGVPQCRVPGRAG